MPKAIRRNLHGATNVMIGWMSLVSHDQMFTSRRGFKDQSGMPNTCRHLNCLAIAILLATPSIASSEEVPRHVVVISIDGFAAYLVDDPRVPLPTIRRLAREGAIVSGGMTVSNPSVTWPNHTTLVTSRTPGRHGLIANGVSRLRR